VKQVLQDQLVLRDQLAQQALQVLLEKQVLQVRLVLRVKLVLQALLVKLVLQVLLEKQVLQVQLALLVPLVTRALQDQLAPQVTQDLLVKQEPPEVMLSFNRQVLIQLTLREPSKWIISQARKHNTLQLVLYYLLITQHHP
jgi:hypothetical protein